MRRRAPLIVLGVLAVASMGACSEEKGRTGEGYCGQIKLNLKVLNEPDIDDGAAVTRTIEIYRTIAASAPAAIEPEWEQLLTSLETASTVNPDDPESLQRVADTARSTRPAATRVQQYTDQLCDLQIASPPPVTNPVTVTTTIPGPNTSAPPITGQGGG